MSETDISQREARFWRGSMNVTIFVCSLIRTALKRLRAGEAPGSTGKILDPTGSVIVTIEIAPNAPSRPTSEPPMEMTVFDEKDFRDAAKKWRARKCPPEPDRTGGDIAHFDTKAFRDALKEWKDDTCPNDQ